MMDGAIGFLPVFLGFFFVGLSLFGKAIWKTASKMEKSKLYDPYLYLIVIIYLITVKYIANRDEFQYVFRLLSMC